MNYVIDDKGKPATGLLDIAICYHVFGEWNTNNLNFQHRKIFYFKQWYDAKTEHMWGTIDMTGKLFLLYVGRHDVR